GDGRGRNQRTLRYGAEGGGGPGWGESNPAIQPFFFLVLAVPNPLSTTDPSSLITSLSSEFHCAGGYEGLGFHKLTGVPIGSSRSVWNKITAGRSLWRD